MPGIRALLRGRSIEDPESVLDKLELTSSDFLLNAGAALFVDCGINDLQMAKFASNERITFTDIRRQAGSSPMTARVELGLDEERTTVHFE